MISARFNPMSALMFQERNPFQIRDKLVGIPPQYQPTPDVRFVGGIPMSGNAPLAVLHRRAQEFLVNPPTDPTTQRDTKGVYAAEKYGDSGTIPVTLAANVPQLVLRRPQKTRTMLLIQNQNVAGNVNYNFDAAPTPNVTVAIAPGGNRLWDSAVPQGDLWLMSGVNAVVVVEFINKDITSPFT